MWSAQSTQQKESELRNSRSCHICLKKQAEKNAACTVNSAEGVWDEELEKLPHLLGEQIRNCNITKEQSFAVQFQSSSRSKLWKVNKINYLQNQICVLKLYSVWFLLCYTCHVYSLFACLLVFVWVYAWNIEDNVWFKCGGGNQVVLHKIRWSLSPITSSVVPWYF